MSVLDHVNLSNAAILTEYDDILISSADHFGSLRGIYEFSKNFPQYKMLLFCNNPEMIRRLNNYKNVIVCKTDLKCVEILRYLPGMTTLIKYNHGFVCDIVPSRYSWNNIINSFKNIIKYDSKYNTYSVPLAGELLDDVLSSNELFNIKTWHRFSHNNMIFRYGNIIPLEIMDSFISEYNNVNMFLCGIVKYIEENEIPFNYKIACYTHRTPFYYWLEHVKPSIEKQKEFLQLVNSDKETVSEYLEEFDHTKRKKFYTQIKRAFNGNYEFFDNETVIECIKRFCKYLLNSDDTIYCKRW